MKLLFALIFPFVSCFAISAEPWLAPQAVEVLDRYLSENPDARVLEFGSGGSTLWLSERTNNLISVEHHPDWYAIVLEEAANMESSLPFELYLLERPYYTFADQFEDESFDIIVVDGRNRKGCILHALPKLKQGGILMLDDSERIYYHAVFPLMKGWQTIGARRNPASNDTCVTRWWIKP